MTRTLLREKRWFYGRSASMNAFQVYCSRIFSNMPVEVLFQPARVFFIFLALFGRPPEFCRILRRLLARHFPLFLLGKAAKVDDLGHFLS